MSPARICVFTAASAASIFGRALISGRGRAGPGARPDRAGSRRRRPPLTRSNRPNQSRGGASFGRRAGAAAPASARAHGRPHRRGSPPRAGPRSRSRQARTSPGIARLDDLRRPGDRASAVPPGRASSSRTKGAARPCHDARRRAHVAARRRDSLGLQRLRPLQDRGRPFQFAHDGADDGRLPLCRERCATRALLERDRAGRGRALRIARADRQGPRHRPRRPARPFRRAARPDRSRRGRPVVAAIRDTGRLSSAARTRSPSTRRATCASSSASGCRTIRTACASPPSTRPAATLDSAVSYSVGGGAVVDEAEVARNAPPEGGWDMPYHLQLAATSCSRIAEREGLTIADIARANERAGLSDAEIDAAARRDRRGDVGLHRPRHGGRAASCPAGST